jgi:hypothetical protein
MKMRNDQSDQDVQLQPLNSLHPAPDSAEDTMDHSIKNPAFTPVSGHRAPQIHERGLSAVQQVCGPADDKGDAVHCDRLPDDGPC